MSAEESLMRFIVVVIIGIIFTIIMVGCLVVSDLKNDRWFVSLENNKGMQTVMGKESDSSEE